MAQVFDRSSNALARASLVIAGLIVIALGVGLDQLQRSPWVTRQGQRPDQPVPFSHKHHVEGLGLQCQYCHTSVEKSSYAGIPPTKTCINCHAQIWTNAALLEPVRHSWATGESIHWIRVHDLPDYVYFNHEIHVNKGIGCASCHGRVDQMPLMYQQNTLQMEWCLNCHRNPAVNLRPTSEIYNMAWSGPSTDKPVWCAETGKGGYGASTPTAQGLSCTTKDPSGENPKVAMLQQLSATPRGMSQPQSGTELQPHPVTADGQTASDLPPANAILVPASYQKFTSQEDLGKYLTQKYHIRTPNELSSCEVCHR
ncbi:cytochrome c3 family protein [Granulicella sp. WH15]|uniref:cytochrome c3 family protein n=1 Tax=Granulicella sp. WH15 TaxID=2602070 RepID=UPI0013678566|nr:cytochrome c3 family protein [Granulicella sp. WH15]QHN01985.1 cytochrome c3 family protein [Granulicella sp. WH15]